MEPLPTFDHGSSSCLHFVYESARNDPVQLHQFAIPLTPGRAVVLPPDALLRLRCDGLVCPRGPYLQMQFVRMVRRAEWHVVAGFRSYRKRILAVGSRMHVPSGSE